MIGVHYHHPLITGLDGECTTLILTKEDSDALFQTFPAGAGFLAGGLRSRRPCGRASA